MNGASNRVGQVLRKFRVRPAFSTVRTLTQIFKKSKERPTINRVQGIVYKMSCHDCAFIFVGESERLWKSRGAEHDPGRASNSESTMITISTHDTPTSSNMVLTTTTRGFSWSHGTQLWTVPLLTRENNFLALTCR